MRRLQTQMAPFRIGSVSLREQDCKALTLKLPPGHHSVNGSFLVTHCGDTMAMRILTPGRSVRLLKLMVRAGGNEPPCGISWSKLIASGTFDCSRALTTPQGTRSATRSRTHSTITYISTSSPRVNTRSASPGKVTAHATAASAPIRTSPFRAKLDDC